MNYSNNPNMVRCDRFRRESGKWYDTFALDMQQDWDAETPIHAVAAALDRSIKRSAEFIYVVLDPYHRNAYPVMVTGNETMR